MNDVLSVVKNIGCERYMEKIAGGPGSGVSGNNTVSHPLPKSSHISVGNRKAMLDHMPHVEEKVDVEDITHSCQDKYVHKKLLKFLQNPDWITDKPIDILKAPNNETVVVDGNHRYIAAKQAGIKTLKARVYTSRKNNEV